MREARRAIETRVKGMRTQFETWRQQFVDFKDYVAPYLGRALTGDGRSETNDGTKKTQKIFDGTPGYALGVAASGMLTGMTPPARPWFRLTLADPDMTKLEGVKEWLEEVERRIYDVFNRSNFYSDQHTANKELILFGTAASTMLESYETVLWFRNYTMGEYLFSCNPEGKPDTFYRTTWMTAKQMVEELGIDNLSISAKTAYERSNTEELFQVANLIEPNDSRIELKASGGRKFRSVYYEPRSDSSKVLAVRGFDDFPVAISRWAVIGNNAWGFSPTFDMLPDIKDLHLEKKEYLEALAKVTKPPLIAPGTMKAPAINSIPNGLSHDNSVSASAGLRPLYQINPQLAVQLDGIERLKNDIKTGYFNDLFKSIIETAAGRRTATEVIEMHNERLSLLGPVVESRAKTLDVTIERVYGILERSGMLPEPPQAIAGMDIKIEYISMLAQAQKAMGVTAIEQTFGFAGQLAAVYPQILDNLDPDEAITVYGENVGASAKVFRSKSERDALRMQRAQEEQQAQNMVMAQNLAQGAKTLSETDMGTNNALNAMLGRPTQ